MGYSTKLYAVDLAALTHAMGSNDSNLLRRIQAAKEPAPPKNPRVLITLDSEIILNGKLVTPDEFKTEICKPKWAGTILAWYQRTPTTKAEQKRWKAGQFGQLGRFNAFFSAIRLESGIQGTSGYSDEEAFQAGAEDDEISVDQALEELVTGQPPSDLAAAHQYGYAFERLCDMFGTLLETLNGKGRLKQLKLDTRLTETRVPVALPKYDDFPYISYCSADEVQEEVKRLRPVDLAFADNALLEKDRRRFLEVLELTLQQQKGLVGFYY